MGAALAPSLHAASARSYLEDSPDMLFTFLVLIGIAGGLLLARRPKLRAKLLRRKKELARA